jgi:3-oxoacyl-[acyl-carrier-protein] synthase-3
MVRASLLGTGRYLPGSPVTNDVLARVMDTSDAWIQQRTGIAQRHFAPEGTGSTDLAVPAAERALAQAGVAREEIDYVIFNTMTPDSILPGPAALFSHKLGITGVPCIDLRQQCAAIPFSFALADALIRAGSARNVLIACAETHAAFMPWQRWDRLDGTASAGLDVADFERATQHRGIAVVFGDGAGAMVVGARSGDERSGILAVETHSDGRGFDALRIRDIGFQHRGLIRPGASPESAFVPQMNGPELFKSAVQRLPLVVESVCRRAEVRIEDVDLFLAHQANDRINRGVREALGLPIEKVPSNIARYGNTSSATLPILADELIEEGRLQRGQLVCFFALGAGLHWGAALMRM